MGWFSSLFKKEKELQKAYLDIKELQRWFDSKSELHIESLRESIKEDIDRIGKLIAQTREASKALDEAKLRNDKMPERVIQIMEGNRKSYINAVNQFMGKLEPPSAINFNTVSDFISEFEDNLSSFTKISARNYRVLQEFFAHESGNIAGNIREMDIIMRGLLDNDYKKINEITASISKLNEMLKKKETAEKMLYEEEKERDEMAKTVDSINQGLAELKKSRDYKFLKDTESKKEDVISQMKDIEKGLFELFAPLERPMRKFAKIAADDEELISSYSKSPVNSVFDDKELRILQIMGRMRSAIEKGDIELKDKAKEKAINQIGMINEMALKNFVGGYNSLKELHAEKEKSLKMNTALQKQNELEYKLNHLKDKLAAVEQNIGKLKRFLEMPEMEETIQSISKDILDVLNTDLRIKMDNKVIGKMPEAKSAEAL